MAEIHNKKQAGVPSRLAKWVRGGQRRLAEGAMAGKLARLRARRSDRPVRKILIFSDRLSVTSEQQLAPLVRYRQTIAAQLGFVFEFSHVDRLERYLAKGFSGYSAVGLKLIFNTPAAQAETMAKTLFDAARADGARGLVFDGDDDSCVLWPGMIDACDAYIKKHRFADPEMYKESFVGKTNLTSYANATYGVDFSDDIIPHSKALTQNQIDKILLGWNIGLDDKIVWLAQDLSPQTLGWPKQYDISCRASVTPEKWIFGMRDAAVKAIEAMRAKLRIHAPTDRVGQQEYYNEMLESRFSVSPFGFGELCWRDFEAILCGSVLIKPDMAHIETWPNLFVAGETYIPVAWDFTDLDGASAPLATDEALRLRMAETARGKLLDALTPDAFLNRLDKTLREAGLG